MPVNTCFCNFVQLIMMHPHSLFVKRAILFTAKLLPIGRTAFAALFTGLCSIMPFFCVLEAECIAQKLSLGQCQLQQAFLRVSFLKCVVRCFVSVLIHTRMTFHRFSKFAVEYHDSQPGRIGLAVRSLNIWGPGLYMHDLYACSV